MCKIKICGITAMEEIGMMNELKPEYIGFVFAPSKRRIDPLIAKRLRDMLAPQIKVVGVFVDEQPEEVARTVKLVGCQMIQLHGKEDQAYCRALRRMTQLPLIKAIGVVDQKSLEDRRTDCEYRLLDTVVAGSCGGQGKTFDWRLLERGMERSFVAGGITPDNVCWVKQYSPYGIDVSSGVEYEGLKDYEKVKQLIEKVRG